ncbi:MAG: T9SS type A sorting domain-containing protein [Bacteroidota bacterium]
MIAADANVFGYIVFIPLIIMIIHHFTPMNGVGFSAGGADCDPAFRPGCQLPRDVQRGFSDVFYHLQQVDQDRRFVYSDTKYLHFDQATVHLSPIPASSSIVITTVISGTPKQLKIMDINGKLVLKTQLLQEHQVISISSLVNGLYIAEISADKTSIKFIKN